MDAIIQFREAILAKGWDPGTIIPDGRFHRFDIDRRGDKNGSYIFFPDGVPGGWFRNWKGETSTWCAKNGELTPDERAAFQKRIQQIEKDRAAVTEKAKRRALFIWERSIEPDPEHPYLVKKGIKPYGIRQFKGAVVVPVKDLETSEILSLQFIGKEGKKRFLSNGKVQGCAFWIRGDKDNPLALAEGYATAVSIHEATGRTAVVAFNCGNLEAVAEKIQAKHPDRALVVCGDDDAWTTRSDGTPWNPGKEKALSIGWKLNLEVAIPHFRDRSTCPTDFNDLCQLEGIGTVKTQIEGSKHPRDILLDEVKTDPGAPYRPENLEALRTLKQRDLSAYVAYREKLKSLKVGVTTLDKAIEGKTKYAEKGKGGLSHLDIAKRVVEGFGSKNIFNTEVFIWKWNGKGLWEKAEDRDVKRAIHKEMDEADISKSVVESVLDLVKTEIYRPHHNFDVDTTAINCLNGELHWTGNNWELREHSRENFRTTQIPVEYDPKATALRFERFLMEVFEGDPDQAEKAFLVCEALGYSLLSSTEYEKFFLLIGPGGANGKSVLMETLAALVGYKNVAAVQPSQFENRFQRAHLHCKLVNLVTEIAEGHEIADAQLKAIVSGELTTAEHKHKAPFDFQPYATCWFGTNHMPHTRDFSEALFRRAIIIPFNRTFAEHEQDKNLKAKLKEELPGILNLALEALAGVFKRGEFTKTKSCEMAKDNWRLECDQVAQFAEERALFGAELKTLLSDAYRIYKEWAAEVGIRRTLGRRKFTDRMTRLGAKSDKGTGGYYYLFGIHVQ